MRRANEEGEEALDAYKSKAHYTYPYQTPPEIVAETYALHQVHPEWGRRRLAHQVRKAHHWEPVIGPTKVGKLLGEWRAAEAETASTFSPQALAGFDRLNLPGEEGSQPIVQHADMPDKTYNIDLFFLPEEQVAGALSTAQDSLEPAGPEVEEASEPSALAISKAVTPATERTDALPSRPGVLPSAPSQRPYPGQAFQAGRDYDTNMAEYAQQRQAKLDAPPTPKPEPSPEEQALAEAQRQLNHDVERLRLERAALRQQRQAEDAAYREARQSHQQQVSTGSTYHQAEWEHFSSEERAAHKEAHQADQATWQEQRQLRREQKARREEEDAAWRQQRRALRERQAVLDAQLLAWVTRGLVAVLLVVDNCTRETVALVLLTAGLAVSAEMVVAALTPLLPLTLRYLISDNGTQFIAQGMRALLEGQGIVHVRIAPRRPCTNGIAERLVRTIKEMLARCTWHNTEELAMILPQVQEEYNDRPHQGKELKGLSPNEFKRRLMASSAI
jgi:transposase InsO family protein